jgi:hypothetical protein
LNAPYSHQSVRALSRTNRAAVSTSVVLQNFQSSFAARENWKRLIGFERVEFTFAEAIDRFRDLGEELSKTGRGTPLLFRPQPCVQACQP